MHTRPYPESAPGNARPRKVAILASSGVEEIELVKPRSAVEEAGARTEVLSIESGEIQAMNHDVEKAGRVRVDRQVSDASVDDYDALLLPGEPPTPTICARIRTR